MDDLLTYLSADRVRKLQTKLTRVGNGIKNDVLDDLRVRQLFTSEELAALQLAATALTSAKAKIEHLKEKKVREEKILEAHVRDTKLKAARAVRSLSIVQPAGYMDKERLLLLIAITDGNTYYDYDIDYSCHPDVSPQINDERRQGVIRTMYENLLTALESIVLRKAWEHDYSTGRYSPKERPSDALNAVLASMEAERERLERQYHPRIEALEIFNRRMTAKQLRGKFTAIDGGKSS